MEQTAPQNERGLGRTPGSAGSHNAIVNTLESSLLPQQTPRSGRSDVLQGVASHMLNSSSPPFQHAVLAGMADAPEAPFRPPGGWPGFISATAGGDEGYDKLGTSLPERGGLYGERGALFDSLSTRTPSMAPATMSQTAGFRGLSSASGPLVESGPADLPSLKRPETPILAYVDRASMPGFVDSDERESRLQQFDRDREWQELSSWPPPATRGIEQALLQHSGQLSSEDQWEAELIEWKKKYGCPDVDEVAPAVQSTAAVSASASSSSAAATQLAATPDGRAPSAIAIPTTAAPATMEAPPSVQLKPPEVSVQPAMGPESSELPEDPSESRSPSRDDARKVSRVSFFEAPRASDPSVDLEVDRAAAASSGAQSAPSVGYPAEYRHSMVDTDIDMAEMKRKSMVQRQSVLPQELERPDNPEHMERPLPRASQLDADIDMAEMKRRSMAPVRSSVLPHALERPDNPETLEGDLPRGSHLDMDIDMTEVKRKSMAQERRSVMPQDLARPDNPETMERDLPRGSHLDTDIDMMDVKRKSMAQERRSVMPQDILRPGNPETMERELPRGSNIDTDIDMMEMKRKSMAQERRSVLPQDLVRPDNPETLERELPGNDALDDDIDAREMKRKSMAQERRSVLPQDLYRPGAPEDDEERIEQEARAVEARTAEERALAFTSEALSRAEAEGRDLLQQVATFQTGSSSAQAAGSRTGGGFAAASAKGDAQSSNWAIVPSTTIAPQPPATGPPPEAERPPRPGRRLEYTDRDLALATETAKTRVKADGSWRSEYSETGLQVRDFFIDIRRQREKDKGRQATGPLWVHLSTQAKNLANQFSLPELLEALKLFCSVRHDDYELYMRLLGEIPHYIKQATADQLCELVRLLARRRLRERNYVDMVAAHLLQKIRVANDAVPARVLVKTANAFAALECRSNPKFVEHFLRHMEHRMVELDATLCCLVSPVFIANFMNDSLRRAYLQRCAETQAGFGGPLEDARNVACTELVLRKEHHSLVVSLPSYVIRYLDKVREHAKFDKYGTVLLPLAAAPDGPKGSQRADMSVSLQRKASTATGGASADVFSSDMHRDVSACLTHLGIEHENGSLCGPYLLDIVALDMVTPTKRIVYEVNSPHHYYEGTQQLIADKRLRHRMLGRLGHQLHMVNAEEWRALSAAQKMTRMLKMQQQQQELNAKEEKIKAAANTMRAPLPALAIDSVKQSDPLKLKSISNLSAPIRVPVPPSQRGRYGAY